MQVPFLNLKVQYKQIEAEVLPVVSRAMADGAFIGGEQVLAFEEEFARFCGARHCIGVNSGTDALRFALMAAGVGAGDEVVTVSNTFIATTEAISQVGAKPVFVDIDPVTYNIDVSQVEACITARTKALLPVHLYGQPADMDALLRIAAQHNLVVVEDACQAHGAVYKGKKAGSMGVSGCFSFYPGKNLGAFGDAGAVVTNDDAAAAFMRMLRDHGQSQKYFHDIEGYNGRLDAVQAGVLRIKLKRLAAWNEARRRNAALYSELLSGVPGVVVPLQDPSVESVFHLYVVLVDDRDRLQAFLQAKGIATGLHYPLPLHLQKAYAHMGHQKGDFPVTERVAERLLSLPMFPELKTEQIEYVVDRIKEFLA